MCETLLPNDVENSVVPFVIEIPKDEPVGYLDQHHDDGLKEVLDTFGDLVCKSIEFLRDGQYDKVFRIIHDITALSRVLRPILKDSAANLDEEELKELAMNCVEIVKKTLDVIY